MILTNPSTGRGCFNYAINLIPEKDALLDSVHTNELSHAISLGYSPFPEFAIKMVEATTLGSGDARRIIAFRCRHDIRANPQDIWRSHT